MPTQTMSTMIDVVGLILILGSAVSVILCAVALRAGRGSRRVALGASFCLFFAAAAAMTDRLSPVLGWTNGAPDKATHLLAALACVSAAFTLDALLRRWLWFGTLREGDHSKVPNIIIGLGSFSLYAVTAMIAASQIFRYDVTALAATSGLVAIVIGYSAQPTLSELFAGLALNLSRPFKEGDSIQVDGVWGVVVDSGWRSVNLRTYEGTMVTLPNSKMVSLRVTNLDLPDHNMRHHIPFVIDVDVPPGKVQAVGVAAMARLTHVLKSRPPMVLFKNVTDQGMAYEAIFWHADPNYYILRRDEVGSALWYAFNRAGIPFSVQRRLLSPAGDAAPALAPVNLDLERAELSGMLRRSALYQAFPTEAIEFLVAQHHRILYGPGELVIRQGEPGASMFVILEGAVDVLLESDGEERRIYGLGVGDTFGHMSLMTGEPRFASVRATSHLVLSEILKASLEPILKAHPDVIDLVAVEIARIDASRRELSEADALNGSLANEEARSLLDQLSLRIRSFFLPA